MTLADVKTALRVTTESYDDEITSLMESAALDLGIAGVEFANVDDIVATAIKTYCKLHFRQLGDMEYRNLKASYDEQKAQLSMATGYTDWGGADE
jgi:hypothetical protein